MEILAPLFASKDAFSKLVNDVINHFSNGEEDILSPSYSIVVSVDDKDQNCSDIFGAAIASKAGAGFVCVRTIERPAAVSSRKTEVQRLLGIPSSAVARRNGIEGGQLQEVVARPLQGPSIENTVEQVLEVAPGLIPKKSNVLICKAWVDSGEHLSAAVRLLTDRLECTVCGVAAVRLNINTSTQEILQRFSCFAKSKPLCGATAAPMKKQPQTSPILTPGPSSAKKQAPKPRCDGVKTPHKQKISSQRLISSPTLQGSRKARKMPEAYFWKDSDDSPPIQSPTKKVQQVKLESACTSPKAPVITDNTHGNLEFIKQEEERLMQNNLEKNVTVPYIGKKELERTEKDHLQNPIEGPELAKRERKDEGYSACTKKKSKPIEDVSLEEDPEKLKQQEDMPSLLLLQTTPENKNMKPKQDSLSRLVPETERTPKGNTRKKRPRKLNGTVSHCSKLNRIQPDEGVSCTFSVGIYEANDPTEDRYACRVDEAKGLEAWLVADGHGGGQAAEFVKSCLIDQIFCLLDDCPTEGEIRDAIQIGFLQTDRNFLEKINSEDSTQVSRNAGCCVVLALFARRVGKIFLAHVGDCRAVAGTMETMHLMNHHEGPSSKCPSVRKPKVARGGYAPSSRERRQPRRQSRRLAAVALTRDHNCANSTEASAVTSRSRDPRAIRPAASDNWRRGALDRVAGSLAVTRAIGDGYLKEEQYSISPYRDNVPYITAEPEISIFNLTPDDRFLVLATDGVWEHASNEEIIHLISSKRNQNTNCTENKTINTCNEANAIVDLILEKSAQLHKVELDVIKKLEKGSARRAVHDDICALVVTFCWE